MSLNVASNDQKDIKRLRLLRVGEFISVVEQHENRRAFLGQAVLVANLQKANKYNVAEAKLLAI